MGIMMSYPDLGLVSAIELRVLLFLLAIKLRLNYLFLRAIKTGNFFVKPRWRFISEYMKDHYKRTTLN